MWQDAVMKFPITGQSAKFMKGSSRISAANDDTDFIVETLLKVYSSWIDKAISNYNTDFFYQSREYVFESWEEGTALS